MWRCKNCKGTKVQVTAKAWLDMNTEKLMEVATEWDPEVNETWCEDCDDDFGVEHFEPGAKVVDLTCPVTWCRGEVASLGALGSIEHYRCRNCGIDFSKGYVPR